MVNERDGMVIKNTKRLDMALQNVVALHANRMLLQQMFSLQACLPCISNKQCNRYFSNVIK